MVGAPPPVQRDWRSQRPQRERGPRPPREDATSEAPMMEEGGGQGGVWVCAGGRPGRPNRSVFLLSGGLAGRRSGSPM